MALTIAALLAGAVCLDLAVVSHVTQARDQRVAFDALRQDLALGTAPVTATQVPTDETAAASTPAELLPAGTPVALMSVPRLRLHDTVVLEDTTSGVLQQGPGHDRRTAMPGQAGWVQVLGKRWTYGAPFNQLGTLRPGDTVTFVTGQGTSTYTVTGSRRDGQPAPSLANGQGRLVLVTATGAPFVAEGALYVDAVLSTTPTAAGPAQIVPNSPAAAPLAGDGSACIMVLLWSQALLGGLVGLAWARRHWGRPQAWFVGVPVLTVVLAGLAGAVSRLLPNLL